MPFLVCFRTFVYVFIETFLFSRTSSEFHQPFHNCLPTIITSTFSFHHRHTAAAEMKTLLLTIFAMSGNNLVEAVFCGSGPSGRPCEHYPDGCPGGWFLDKAGHCKESFELVTGDRCCCSCPVPKIECVVRLSTSIDSFQLPIDTCIGTTHGHEQCNQKVQQFVGRGNNQ